MAPRKRKPTQATSSLAKRPRPEAADVRWFRQNLDDLCAKSFAVEFQHFDRQRCHARFRNILKKHFPEETSMPLLEDFETWRGTVDCVEFWKERQRAHALAETEANCSDVINTMLVTDSAAIVASQSRNSDEIAPVLDTTTSKSEPHASDALAALNDEYERAESPDLDVQQQEQWAIGGVDVIKLFAKYVKQADAMPKPLALESSIQEILALSDVLFLAEEQDSACKMAVFGERLLHDMRSDQLEKLLSKMPPIASSKFTKDEFMDLVEIVAAIDEKRMSPKVAKLKLLSIANELAAFKSNVVEGIADLLTKLPLYSIADKSSFGEVDIQTRYLDPLLSALVADTMKKVALRWANKQEALTMDIRPDAIISTVVQRAFGDSLGFGETKPGDASTTNHSLCVDTLKLAILARNAALKHRRPILTFQANGCQLIFYITQMIHRRLFTMTEIARVALPEALDSLHSFVTFKNLDSLLRVTLIFWHCCYDDDEQSPTPSIPSPRSAPIKTDMGNDPDSPCTSSSSPHITDIYHMIRNSTSKKRDCSINYQ